MIDDYPDDESPSVEQLVAELRGDADASLFKLETPSWVTGGRRTPVAERDNTTLFVTSCDVEPRWWPTGDTAEDEE